MNLVKSTAIALLLSAGATAAWAHGDVAPQPVNTDALPEIGEEWLYENPYREQGEDVFNTAVEIGASGFIQNCARCHGLNAVSGGLAPDLRFLEANMDGDEWFVERFQYGYTQNGITKMPAFGDLLGQKAAWAIRSYVETRPSEDSLEEVAPRLSAIHTELKGIAEKVAGGESFDGVADKVSALDVELAEIAATIGTESGAPIADSAASKSATLLDGTPQGLESAIEALTIGLSAAH